MTLRIETRAGFPRDRAASRITAKSVAYPGPSTDIVISGSFTPDEAEAIGKLLIERAAVIRAANARRDDAEINRRVRSSSPPITARVSDG